jgi:hypothetical protein
VSNLTHFTNHIGGADEILEASREQPRMIDPITLNLRTQLLQVVTNAVLVVLEVGAKKERGQRHDDHRNDRRDYQEFWQ